VLPRTEKGKTTMLYRARLTTVLVAAGVALTVWPTTSASASASRSSTCKAYAAAEAKEARASTALQQAIANDKWPKVQKLLLSTFAGATSSEKELAASLRNAPAKVKAAAALALKLDHSFTGLITRAPNYDAYASKAAAAEQTPKVQAALKVLSAYSSKLCGSTTPTT
jgi:hypothetical protein